MVGAHRLCVGLATASKLSIVLQNTKSKRAKLGRLRDLACTGENSPVGHRIIIR